MIGPERRMKKRLKEYEERGIRKSPFGPGKYRRGHQITIECGKI